MSEKIVTGKAPVEIAKAILATIKGVTSLGKTGTNTYQKYKYAPIDAYYESVPRVAAEHGLFWRFNEEGWEIIPNLGKEGAVRVTYVFELLHSSGERFENYTRFTIVHPLQGAQTAGAAASYAEKLMMRTTFKVVTGEPDADATDQDLTKPVAPTTKATAPPAKASTNGASHPTAAVSPPTSIGEQADNVERLSPEGFPILKNPPPDWSSVEAIFTKFVTRCATYSDIVEFNRSNLAVLDRMKENYPEARARVSAAFNAHSKFLKEQPVEM